METFGDMLIRADGDESIWRQMMADACEADKALGGTEQMDAVGWVRKKVGEYSRIARDMEGEKPV